MNCIGDLNVARLDQGGVYRQLIVRGGGIWPHHQQDAVVRGEDGVDGNGTAVTHNGPAASAIGSCRLDGSSGGGRSCHGSCIGVGGGV